MKTKIKFIFLGAGLLVFASFSAAAGTITTYAGNGVQALPARRRPKAGLRSRAWSRWTFSVNFPLP
jgi:hypothetical protein